MGLGSNGAQPTHYAVVPAPTLQSLTFTDGDLKEARQFSRKVLHECQNIRHDYNAFVKQRSNSQIFTPHDTVSIENALWALERTDHTSLRATGNEDAAWMQRMGQEALLPVPMRSICIRPEEKLLTSLMDELNKRYDETGRHDTGIAVVVGYDGNFKPSAIKKTIEKTHKILQPFQQNGGLIDVDSVDHYKARMDGDLKKSDAALEAYATAKDFGFTWKHILVLMVHAYANKNTQYGNDTFKSIYDAGISTLEHGADCLKTSTGNTALEPYHEFDKKDTGPIERALPMLFALSDFNAKNNAQRWPKFSGGNESIVDVAVLKHASERFLGTDVVDNVVLGTSPLFRGNLLDFINDESAKLGLDPLFDPRYTQPYHMGLSDIVKNNPTLAPIGQAPDDQPLAPPGLD